VAVADEQVPTAARGGLRVAAIRGAGWSLLQAWGGRLISTAVFFLLARLLVPADFGVVALATIFVELGQMVMNRGFGATIVQREDLTDEDLDAVFWFSFGIGVAMTTISWLTAGLLAGAFGEPEFAPVFRVLSLNWVLGAFWSVPQNVLQRELRFAGLAARRLLAVSVSGTVAVVLAVAGAGVWSLVAMATVQSVVSIVVLWTASGWRPSWRFSLERIRAMRGFAARVVAIDVTRFFTLRGEGLVVGAVLGPVTLGYYAVAQRFLTLLRETFGSSIGQVAFPVFSRLQDDRERRTRALRSVIRLSSVAAFPAFVGLAVLAPEVVEVLLGPTWEPSVVLVQLLCIAGLRASVTQFVSGVVVSTGDAALQLRTMLIGVAVKAVCLAIGVQFGVEGIAAAVAVSSWVTLPITFWALRRKTDLTARSFLRQTLEPAVAATVMAVAILACRAWLAEEVPAAAFLVVGIVVGGLAYLGTLMLIGRSVVDEARSNLRQLGRRGAARGRAPEPAEAR
jgi:PST family polysaccharide transporter